MALQVKSRTYATISSTVSKAIPGQLIPASGRRMVCRIPAAKSKSGPGTKGKSAPSNPPSRRLRVMPQTIQPE